MKLKLSLIAWCLIGVLVSVFVALVVVAVVHGIRLSGDLTYGDLLVGLGTFALAGLTAVLADATFGLDKRAASREQIGRERQLRGVARLIDGELKTVQESIESAVDSGTWMVINRTPHGAWDRDAALVLASLSPTEGLELIAFFSKLAEWEEVVRRFLIVYPNSVKFEVEDPSPVALNLLRIMLSRARVILEPFAYGTGEVSP